MKAGRNPSGRIRNRIVEQFLRAISSVKVVRPSEWRQWKKRRNAENPDTVEARRNVERLRHKREVQQNNLRIEAADDNRLNHNFAHGKLKRAGVFATSRGL